MWAFGTGAHGLALTERQFWLLTPREFDVHKARYEAARGIKPKKGWRDARANWQDACSEAADAGLSHRMVKAESRAEAIDRVYAARCNKQQAKPRNRRPRNG